MKKTLFLGFAMTFVTFGAFAQESNTNAPNAQMQRGGSPEERAKRQADHINSIAQLTPDQYAKVVELNKSFGKQREALRASSTQGEDMKAKYKALNEQEQAQLKTILTPEQFQKVMDARKQRMNTAPKGE